MYDRNTVYVVGHGKTGAENAITTTFNIFFIAFIINSLTDRVVDLDCSATVDTTKKFIKDLFIGRDFSNVDETLINEISNRYFGSSQRAVIVAYKDAVKKYNEVKMKTTK